MKISTLIIILLVSVKLMMPKGKFQAIWKCNSQLMQVVPPFAATNKVTSVLVWTYWSVVPLAMFLSQCASFQTVPPPRSALLAILWLLAGSTPLITLVANHCNLHRGNCFQWSPSADLLSSYSDHFYSSISFRRTYFLDALASLRSILFSPDVMSCLLR